MGKVKVHVTYCGGWGYGSKFRSFQTELDSRYPGKLDITSESTPGITGWFEVTVNGQMVHSKKGGDGYVDKSNISKINSVIENAMKT